MSSGGGIDSKEMRTPKVFVSIGIGTGRYCRGRLFGGVPGSGATPSEVERRLEEAEDETGGRENPTGGVRPGQSPGMPPLDDSGSRGRRGEAGVTRLGRAGPGGDSGTRRAAREGIFSALVREGTKGR